ncbi:MAG TPA: amylo-alpha-1,6-glucosidase [Candidatus Xenobia bacterium]|jgi:glycogen debranching enzyme
MTVQVKAPVADPFPHDEPFSVHTTASKSEESGQVIKQGETFAILDRFGDVLTQGLSQQGIFHRGTRYLSRFVLGLAQERPIHLSSTIKEDDALITLDLMNPEIFMHDEQALPAGTVHLLRTIFLWKGACHQRLQIQHYGVVPVTVPLRIEFDSDFVDIFEVRGTRPARRGQVIKQRLDACRSRISYQGADGVTRLTTVSFSVPPNRLAESAADYVFRLQPGDRQIIDMAIDFQEETKVGDPTVQRYDEAQEESGAHAREAASHNCAFETNHNGLTKLLHRSLADLTMMVTDTEHGPYPYAGVPWFSCPFGRDGIITALEALWVNPGLARGTLQFLAATQATTFDADRDAEPGKILHEARQGEMANLREIPFGRYYGSVDATPLFVYLAGAYYRQTRDVAFIRRLWPNIEAALRWMEEYGDADKDGFIEYQKQTPNGLSNQGWKDSGDAISHRDGTLASPPIALCEVQAYAYGAWVMASQMLEGLQRPQEAERYRRLARDLQKRFTAAFWLDDLGTYALALDGHKKPCRVRASNAGHCLTMGIADPQHATRLAAGLMAEDMYSGWGIRTLARGEVRYNPMSYHNGSVWPHDNALIALGLARYGYQQEAASIFRDLLDASSFFDLYRLPELMSGFARRPGQGPTRYPVACSPQAWAVGAPFMLLTACLGISLEDGNHVIFRHPVCPHFVQQIQVSGLRGSTGSVDLAFHRHDDDVGITVLRKRGTIEVVVVK